MLAVDFGGADAVSVATWPAVAGLWPPRAERARPFDGGAGVKFFRFRFSEGLDGAQTFGREVTTLGFVATSEPFEHVRAGGTSVVGGAELARDCELPRGEPLLDGRRRAFAGDLPL